MSELVPDDLDEYLESERQKVLISRLRVALRAALDGWAEAWEGHSQPHGEERIAALRKDFLDV